MKVSRHKTHGVLFYHNKQLVAPTPGSTVAHFSLVGVWISELFMGRVCLHQLQ